MKKRSTIGLFIALTIPSILAFAHPGHDHSHWSAAYLHYAFYGSIALCAIGGIAYLTNMLTKSEKSNTANEGGH